VLLSSATHCVCHFSKQFWCTFHPQPALHHTIRSSDEKSCMQMGHSSSIARCRICECVRDVEDAMAISALRSEEAVEVWTCGRVVLAEEEDIKVWTCGRVALAEGEDVEVWTCGRVALAEEEDVEVRACGRVALIEDDAEVWACGRVALTEEEGVESWACGRVALAEEEDVEVRACRRVEVEGREVSDVDI
jgi:ribosomal protein S27AE